MAERWLPVPGWEGSYEVSDEGRVRSLSRVVVRSDGRQQTIRGQLMRAGLDGKGYPRLVLKRAGVYESWSVHRAVLSAFMARADWREWHVNHKDGVRTNNRLDNLEWCTPAENTMHGFKVLGTIKAPPSHFGAEHPNARPVVGRCIDTGEERRYAAISLTATDGFKPSDVSAAISGDQKSHRSWIWRYADQPEPVGWAYRPAQPKRGGENVHARPVEAIAADGSVRRYAAAVLAKADGFNPVCISHVLVGLQRTHGGHRWRYAEEAR